MVKITFRLKVKIFERYPKKKEICCFAMFRIIKYHSLFALDRVALEKERLILVVVVVAAAVVAVVITTLLSTTILAHLGCFGFKVTKTKILENSICEKKNLLKKN